MILELAGDPDREFLRRAKVTRGLLAASKPFTIPDKVSKSVASYRFVSFLSREHFSPTWVHETSHRPWLRKVSPRCPGEGSARRRHEDDGEVAVANQIQVSLAYLRLAEVEFRDLYLA